jgi:hypothetical protein
MEKILSSLGNRVFLMNNVHEDEPGIFQTRWAMSYLRGPLTREQIKTLMAPYKTTSLVKPAPGAPVGAVYAAQPAASIPEPTQKSTGQPPALSPDVSRYFIPPRGRTPSGCSLYYRPRLLGVAKINFSDVKTRINDTQNVVFITLITDEVIP